MLSFVALFLLSNYIGARAQTVQCGTVGGGCSEGSAHNAAVKGAIARFTTGKIYGGDNQQAVFSSSTENSDDSLASIAYSCSDGSSPPPLSGYTIQARLQSILTCANQCGSIPVTDGSKCGFGVIVADNAASQSCFSNAVNIAPKGRDWPTVGTFRSIGCWTDSDTRSLTGGSASDPQMTIEKCVGLSQGFKYAAVEYGIECYWGNNLASVATQANADCNMPCAGNSSELCGDGWRLNVYQDFAYGGGASSTLPSVPTPTVVSSVASFTSLGCYVDSADSRALVNGSQSVYGAGGMTVEECIGLADSWQYAGLEYYGECYWGDVPSYLTSANIQDCNTPCDGNQNEFCGGGNRLLIYQDPDWVDPTRDELADKIEEYMELMAELVDLIQDWHDLIEEYNSLQGAAGSKSRRQSSQLLQAIDLAGQAILNLQPRFQALSKEIETLFRIAQRYRKLSDDEIQARQQLNDAVATQLGNIAAVAVTGVLETAFDVATVALTTLGTPEGLVVVGGTGLFVLGKRLFNSLKGIFNSNPSTPTQPANQPSGTAPSQSSMTSSTATPSATYVVYPKDGSNVGQTQSIETSLEKLIDDSSQLVVYDAGPFGIDFWLVELTQENANVVGTYTTVMSITLYCVQDCYDPTTGSLFERDDGFIAEASTVQPWYPPNTFTFNGESLYEMSYLSQEPGSTIDARQGQYIYDSSAGAGSTVYIIDTGANINRPEFSSGEALRNRVRFIQANDPLGLENDSAAHGTCMLSRIGGNIMGAAKKANVVMVRVLANSAADIWLHALTKVLLEVYLESTATKTVLSLSYQYPPNEVSAGWIALYHTRLQILESYGVFVVTGSGNTPSTTITGYPASFAGGYYPEQIQSLLVVGAASPQGVPWPKTSTDLTAGIPSVYATHNWCAEFGNVGIPLRPSTGTSVATASVAGLAAYFYGLTSLAGRLDTPLQMKRYIESLAWSRNPAYPQVKMVWNGVSDANLTFPVPLRPYY